MKVFKKLVILIPNMFLITGCGIAVADNEDAGGIIVQEDFSDARVAYLGPEGTYTEEAARFFFKQFASMSPMPSVDDAIMEVVSGNADYAVIPQENTIGGAVTDYVDALIRREKIYVVGEVIIPISQTLMGIAGADLKDIAMVCSHAQGIVQSVKWRSENIPDAAVQEMTSTAAAASYVAEKGDKSIAAIAAPGAAELYGLSILAENIQISDANRTRFYVLSASAQNNAGKSHAVFAATCKANRIDDIIVQLHSSGLEFVCIHDRPAGDELGSYIYIIEVINESGITSRQLEEISGITEIRLLGCFDVFEK